MSQPFHVLGPLRHDCTGCGGCCHGVVVFLSAEEQVRVRGFAQAMGLPDPVDQGRLRFEGGRCPFQGDDELCRIHSAHGIEAKPLLGRQYPLVLSRTEQGLRAGVDPGCYDGWRSWEQGPLLESRAGAVETRKLGPRAARHEDRLLDMLELRGLQLARLACLLADEPAAVPGGLPPGFAQRLVTRIAQARLSTRISPEASGAMLHGVMAPVLSYAEALDPASLPAWPVLSPTQDAFAVELIRRMVFLRLVPGVTAPVAVAVLGVAGAVLCAWHDPSPAGFGRGLAGWTRIMRSPAFLEAVAPDPATLLSLATGR
jgi:Fe-S-cluster containining protein